MTHTVRHPMDVTSIAHECADMRYTVRSSYSVYFELARRPALPYNLRLYAWTPFPLRGRAMFYCAKPASSP